MIKVAEAYNRVAERYDAHYRDPVSQAENEFLRKFLERALPPGPIVDLGCGTGLAVDILGIHPERYIGVDISPGMLRVARKKRPAHIFLEADITSLPLSADSYAAAVSLFGPPSYCRSLLDVRHELLRVLHPGGVYFLMLYGMPHTRKGEACVTVEYDEQGLERNHYRTEYLRCNFPEAVVFGMTRGIDYRTPGIRFSESFGLDTLVEGLASPNDFFYLNV